MTGFDTADIQTKRILAAKHERLAEGFAPYVTGETYHDMIESASDLKRITDPQIQKVVQGIMKTKTERPSYFKDILRGIL